MGPFGASIYTEIGSRRAKTTNQPIRALMMMVMIKEYLEYWDLKRLLKTSLSVRRDYIYNLWYILQNKNIKLK